MAESLRELGYQILVVTTLGVTAAIVAINSDPTVQGSSSEYSGNGARTSDQQNYQPDQSGQPENHTQTYQQEELIPNYTPGYITRDNPRARYQIAADPWGLGRTCVRKTNETPSNTLVGMTIVAAGDINEYDGKGTIYDSAGNTIGKWDASKKLIGFEDLSAPAYADSVACGDN